MLPETGDSFNEKVPTAVATPMEGPAAKAGTINKTDAAKIASEHSFDISYSPTEFPYNTTT
jgi:hypothetical protein